MTFNLHLTARIINDWSYTSVPYVCSLCRLGKIFVLSIPVLTRRDWVKPHGSLETYRYTSRILNLCFCHNCFVTRYVSGLTYRGIFIGRFVTQDLIHFLERVFYKDTSIIFNSVFRAVAWNLVDIYWYFASTFLLKFQWCALNTREDIPFETSTNSYQNTWHYIPNSSDMYNHQLDNLKSPNI